MNPGRIKGLPGGQGLDIANRVLRCVSHAHVVTGAIPVHDAYTSFDAPYAGIKKIHHLVLLCIVRKSTKEDPDYAAKFYQVLEQSLLKQYGLDYDIGRTIEQPTRHLGTHYCLENPEVNAIWRTYVLWRSENERPEGAKVLNND